MPEDPTAEAARRIPGLIGTIAGLVLLVLLSWLASSARAADDAATLAAGRRYRRRDAVLRPFC